MVLPWLQENIVIVLKEKKILLYVKARHEAFFIYYASLSAVYGPSWRSLYCIMAEFMNSGLCRARGAGCAVHQPRHRLRRGGHSRRGG